MRVCRVSQTFPTDKNNGKGLHCYHVSKLQQVPTLVVTKFYPDEEYWQAPENVTLKKVSYWQAAFPSGNKFSPAWLIALVSYFVGQLQLLFKAIPALVKFKPTVTHLQSPHAILIGLFNKLFLGAPIVLTFHGSDLLRIKKIKPYHWLLRHVNTVLYVNANMQQDIKRMCPKARLVHTPSGVDLDVFTTDKEQLVKKKKQLVSVGNLRWQKGYKYLLDAFALVLKERPEYELVLVGEGELKDELDAQAKSLGIADKVIFFGRATTEQVRQQLLQSELFVLSSVTEGMPKALLESLACGLPVVVTQVGACEVLAQDVGIAVPAEDPAALAQGIIKLLGDGQAYDKLVSQCAKKVEGYTWNELANRVFKEFEQLKAENR